MKTKLHPPFHYYGGKRRVADEVWERFGHADIYAEPFAGGAAVLLGNPYPLPEREVICDTDGHICNVWRALSNDPQAVADHADYPSIHQDLTARQKWLVQWAKDNAHRLSDDPYFYDAKVAGWWIWGKSGSFGPWCDPNNTHYDKLPRRKANSTGGVGVQVQRVSFPFENPSDKNRLYGWFDALQKRLKNVYVLNRDWTAAVTNDSLAASCAAPKTRCVFLDPPYKTEKRSETLYLTDGNKEKTNRVAVDAYQWAVEHGGEYRIAYCCHLGDFPLPDGWSTTDVSFTAGHTRNNRDQVMFSPACVSKDEGLFR